MKIGTALVFSLLMIAGTNRSAYADPPEASLKEKIETGILRGSYGMTLVVQGIDARSTQQVMNLGGYELNPVLAPFAKRPATLYGIKAAIAASYVYSEYALGRRNKLAAIAMAAAINGVYIAAARHNLRLAAEMRADQAAAR